MKINPRIRFLGEFISLLTITSLTFPTLMSTDKPMILILIVTTLILIDGSIDRLFHAIKNEKVD